MLEVIPFYFLDLILMNLFTFFCVEIALFNYINQFVQFYSTWLFIAAILFFQFLDSLFQTLYLLILHRIVSLKASYFTIGLFQAILVH